MSDIIGIFILSVAAISALVFLILFINEELECTWIFGHKWSKWEILPPEYSDEQISTQLRTCIKCERKQVREISRL